MALASLLARASILAVLFAANESLGPAARDNLVYAVGVVTALQILVDPNALANFYLASHHHFEALRTHSFFAVARLQRILSAVVVVLPPIVVVLSGADGSWAALSVALGVIAFGENGLRFRRVLRQDREEFAAYAAVDLTLGLVRLFTAIILLVAGVEAFALVCVLAGALEAWAARPKRPEGFADTHHLATRNLVGEAWPYVGTTAVTSVYSQGPVLILGLVGSIASAATYAIAARLTQPLEFLPSAIASVHMPRLVRHRASEFSQTVRRQVLVAISAAVPVSALVILIGPSLLDAFGFDSESAVDTLTILAVVLLFKFVSYQLVAAAVARGRIRARFKLSVVIAALSVVGVALVASSGSVAAAAVTLGCEVMLCLGLFLVYLSDRREGVSP